MNTEPLPGTTDRRVAGLLRLLSNNATIVISGARIAREIGVSRSAVWRWVEKLRELGVKVKGQAATGYFLEKVPDILTADELKRRLKGSLFGKRIHHFFKADSTNRVAFELGHASKPEGTVVLAEEQTAGRGRAGHTWHSERATGIYVSLLLRPKLAPVQAPLLTMMAGLSAHTAVEAVTGLVVDLKWPAEHLKMQLHMPNLSVNGLEGQRNPQLYARPNNKEIQSYDLARGFTPSYPGQVRRLSGEPLR